MKKSLHALLFFVFACTTVVYGQGELPVNMYTGTPIISIPIGTITSDGVSDNVSLIYNASGVRVGTPAGNCGVNWSLNAGGSISRQVRGLPDDYSRDGVKSRRGWLYQNGSAVTVAAEIGSIPNTSDLSAACPNPDETADYNKLDALGAIHDSEPDLFSYSAGGYSGQFVFDNGTTPQIRLIPYQDLIITPTFVSSTDKTITAFTITTNTGVVYSFTVADSETRWTSLASPIENQAFTQEMEYYNSTNATSTPTTYKTAWHLSKVKSPSGGEITYFYSVDNYDTDNLLAIQVLKRPQPGYKTENLYHDHRTGWTNYLSAIRPVWGTSIGFTFANKLITTISVYDNRDGDESNITAAFVKKFDLQYNGIQYLERVQEISDNESFPPYEFQYWGHIPVTTNGQDFWGYYNGKSDNKDLYPTLYVYPQLPALERVRIYKIPGYSGTVITLDGADRTTDAELVKSGSLYSITYPWGGSTTLEYEPNQYFDAVAGCNFYGGGVRLKSATYMDGTNPDAKIEKTLTYTDSLGRSSGVLISTPAFAIPLSYHQSSTGVMPYQEGDLTEEEMWKYFTARTSMNLATTQTTKGSAIGYKEVKVFRPNSGYAHFEYDIPATVATENKIARSAACAPGNIITHWGARMYPYAPDAEMDHTRGLVKRKREYDQSNFLVRKTTTTYQNIYKQGSTPWIVSGVRFERYPNAGTTSFLFGKYALQTDAAKVIDEETVTTYDTTNASRYMTEAVKYIYAGTGHKLVTRIQRTSADGTVRATNLRYPLDYGTIGSAADTTSNAIKRLQTWGRNGIPIEQYTTSKLPGGTEKVVGGAITKFSGFGKARVLPQKNFTWRALAPLDTTSFYKSRVLPSGAFAMDPGYDLVSTYLAYDSLDKPSAMLGSDSIPATTLWSTKLSAPVASVMYALPGEFAFSDFETGTEASFDLVDAGTEATGVVHGIARSGKHGLFPEVKMSKVINKGDDVYKLTGWWGKFLTAMVVNVNVKNTAKTISYHSQSYTINKSNYSGQWDFFSIDIPVSTAPAQFYVEITFTLTATYVEGSIYAIDDFAFFPKRAILNSQTYQFPFGPTSSTSEDRTGFTEYDKLGRVKYIRDRDKNILQKKTYQFTQQQN